MRWLEVEDLSPSEFGQLRDAIINGQLEQGSTSGFKVQSATSKQIIARFVKRFEYTEKIQDPFGKVFEMPIFGFDEIDFRLYNTTPKLEVLDASSDAVNILVNKLMSMFQKARAVSDAQAEPLKWLAALAPNLQSYEVTAMTLTDIAVTNSISAKVSLDGVQDVRSGLQKLIGNRKHIVQKLRVESVIAGSNSIIDLYADGKAAFTSSNDRLPHFLRESLTEARQRNSKTI
jgi:hypothetical protein